jgi:hypothetical protein
MGEGMQKQNDSYIQDGVKKIAINFMLIDTKLYFVGSVNTSVLKSEIGNTMFHFYPNANFACCYSNNTFTGETYISLRSVDNATDVSVIAEKFGGGGHRNAAGISVFNTNTIPGILLDRQQCYDLLERIKIITQTIIDGSSLNIVYLNSTHHKKNLGKFLLQTRYIEPMLDKASSRQVSEACSIIRNKNKDMSYYIGLDLACIYYYDDNDDATYFSVVSDNIDLLIMLKDIYSEFVYDTDDIKINDRLKLKFNGFINRLIC